MGVANTRDGVRDKIVGPVEQALWMQRSSNARLGHSLDPYWGVKEYTEERVEGLYEDVSGEVYNSLYTAMALASEGYELPEPPGMVMEVWVGDIVVQNPRTGFRLIGFDPGVAE
jgi:hypothetical protein